MRTVDQSQLLGRQRGHRYLWGLVFVGWTVEKLNTSAVDRQQKIVVARGRDLSEKLP